MLKFVEGDATAPIGDECKNRLIIHCCNDVGGWGSGFVLALNKKWDRPRREYQKWAINDSYWAHKNNSTTPTLATKEDIVIDYNDVQFRLGQIQTVGVDPYLFVVNMIGQRDYGIKKFELNGYTIEHPPVNYNALRECLIRTAQVAIDLDASIHCPRFGCGLAGGEWAKIEEDINEILVYTAELDVTVYDYKG